MKNILIFIMLFTSLLTTTHKSVAQSQHTHDHDRQNGKTHDIPRHDISKLKPERKIVTHNPRVKTTPPGIANSVGYFDITNYGDDDITLININSDITDRTEIHQHTMANGLMKMQKIEALIIAAKSTVKFEPGSYHIMFINVNKPIIEKQQIELTLDFSDGSSQTVTAIANDEIHTQKKSKHKHH